MTTNLTVNSVLTASVDASICQGQTFTLPDGSTVTASGQYPVTLTSSGGCDSIVTTNLTVNSVLTASVDASICQGQTFTLPDGSTVTASGQYPVTLTSSGGCDSIVTTNLTVTNVLTTSVDASICQGQTFTLPDGSTVTAQGQYPVTLTSSGGCDSIVTTNLTVNSVLTASVNASICQGQTFTLPDGSTVTASGQYPVTLISSGGCDSIVTTNLTVNSVLTASVNASICQGQTFTLPDGSTVTASGQYPVTLTSSGGCDSIVTTNLTVTNVLTTSVDASICQGQTFTLPDGSTVTASGQYPVTLTSSGGCDSIVTTNLTVNSVLTASVDASICQGQSFTLPDGSTVTASGQYPVTLTSSGGCDSIVTTNLTVTNVLTTSVDASICQGQTFTLPDGSTVTASGQYPVTLTSSGGCDSIVTTNLTVNSVLTASVDASICQGQTFTLPDGSTVTASGQYPVTLTSSGGCDSIVTTNLTVNSVLTTSVNASICQGQTFTLPDGSTVTASGQYPVTLTSSGGCDSIVTTNLTVTNVLTTSVDASICQGQTFTLPDGSTVTAAGQYPITLTSSGGCDSIVTTNLTVNSVLTASVDASICQGQSFTLPDGSTVTASGQYPVTLTSSGGCDSIVTTNLTVTNVLTTSVDASICQGQTFTLPDGSTVTASGQYPVTLTSSGGCDSIVTTNLTVNSVLTASVDASICQGQSFTLPDGSTVTASGQYPVTLTSSGGCDSIVTTNLTVNSVLTSSVDASICQGQTFTLPDGSTVTASGQYPVTLTSSGGCDSIVTTNLTVTDVLTTSVDASICQGQTFTLPDGSTVTASGQYPVTLTSSGGCDSIVTTNLTLNDLPEALVIAPALICDGDSLVVTAILNAGESILWPDGSTGPRFVFKEGGIFTVLLSNECGEVSSEVEISTEDCTPCAVYLPNAFTPNGDGVNDLFAPIITCDAVEPFLFRIYNRWNELVFETTNPLDSWDGIYKNTKQPTDAYVYYLRYFNGRTGKEEELKGVVTLLN